MEADIQHAQSIPVNFITAFLFLEESSLYYVCPLNHYSLNSLPDAHKLPLDIW